jgi:hypothetical protein
VLLILRKVALICQIPNMSLASSHLMLDKVFHNIVMFQSYLEFFKNKTKAEN